MPGSSGTIASIQLGQTTPADTNAITTSHSYLSPPPSLRSTLSTQTRGKRIKIFQQRRERVLLSFITIAIGPKRDKCLLSVSVLLELEKLCCVCVWNGSYLALWRRSTARLFSRKRTGVLSFWLPLCVPVISSVSSRPTKTAIVSATVFFHAIFVFSNIHQSPETNSCMQQTLTWKSR